MNLSPSSLRFSAAVQAKNISSCQLTEEMIKFKPIVVKCDLLKYLSYIMPNINCFQLHSNLCCYREICFRSLTLGGELCRIYGEEKAKASVIFLVCYYLYNKLCIAALL